MDLFKSFSGKFHPYIFTSDRGGSELLLSFLLENKIECCGKILHRGIDVASEIGFKLKRLNKINSFFYSTGFDNRKVFRLLNFFNNKKIPSYCYLDSIQNLESRFKFKEKEYFPENLIIDETIDINDVRKIGFKKNLIVIENYYLKTLSNSFVRKKNNIKVGLILSDPFDTQDYNVSRFSEYEKEIFFKLFSFLKSQKCKKIYFRMHPADNIKKFDSIPFKKDIILDINKVLIDTLKFTDIAVGHHTNALTISKKLGIESKEYSEIFFDV